MTTPPSIASLLAAARARLVFQGQRASTFIIERGGVALRTHLDMDAASLDVLDELARDHASVFLWAAVDSDWKASLGNPNQTAGDAAMWHLRSLQPVRAPQGAAKEGGWALFYFDLGGKPETVPSELVSQGSQLEAMLQETGAQASVISWYDDTEWLLTITNSHIEQRPKI